MQQILLLGFSKIEGAAQEAYIERVTSAVNESIVNRSTIHQEDKGAWCFSLDKKDNKKLGEITMSNKVALKFMKGFKHLIDACMESDDFTNAERDEWKDMCRSVRFCNSTCIIN